MIEPTYLTIPEVAKILRTPEATVRYWRVMGRGPKAVRIGNRVLYRESDVLEWLAARFRDERNREQARAERHQDHINAKRRNRQRSA